MAQLGTQAIKGAANLFTKVLQDTDAEPALVLAVGAWRGILDSAG